MIDRDIDLTEDFVFIEQEKINNKIQKSSSVFEKSSSIFGKNLSEDSNYDKSIKDHEKTVSYFSEYITDDSDFVYISNFVENLIVTNSLYTFDNYLKYINEICDKKQITTYQHYMLVSEASEFDVFCEECGIHLKSNQLGLRQYCLCIDCSR